MREKKYKDSPMFKLFQLIPVEELNRAQDYVLEIQQEVVKKSKKIMIDYMSRKLSALEVINQFKELEAPIKKERDR